MMPGDDQGDPAPASADDSARDRREEHGHRRHRQGVDPGLQRGEPTHVLEVERVEEEEPTEGGEGRDGDDRGRGERHGPEEAQVDQRLAGPVLPEQERSRATAAATTKAPTMRVDDQPRSGASMMP